MPDFRSLISRMADELDYYRQLLMDDRRETHALATEARAALAEPEPKGPTRRQLLQLAAEFWPEGCEPAQAVPFARAALARWGNHPGSLDSSPQPVPVSEQLPDNRDPECVANWPECWSGGYDPRCCRFPKSCSCERGALPLPVEVEVEG